MHGSPLNISTQAQVTRASGSKPPPRSHINPKNISRAQSTTPRPPKTTHQKQKQKQGRGHDATSDTTDLTPLSDEEMDESATPNLKGRKTPTQMIYKKSPKPSSSKKPQASGSKVITAVGPHGREKKRRLKLGASARKRERDDKFSQAFSGGGVGLTSEDGVSSFGDDESEEERFITDDGFELDPYEGYEVEDLQYGARELDIRQAALSGLWDEDEEHYIDHLSGSEIDQMSQSSVGISDQDIPSSDSDDFSSSSEDDVDEFGFPLLPTFPTPDVPDDNPGLLLMEDWTGQLVLVQPRQERSRSRGRHSQRGSTSRTESVGGSTILSAVDQQGLIIDPDAHEHEFDSDSSFWTALSDEDSNEGDTTDSMDEDEMPIIDSPAMQEMLDARNIGIPQLSQLPPASTDINMNSSNNGQPINPQTPSISTPLHPQTPGQSSSTAGPVMGRFFPITTHPAHYAVIAHSDTPAKSPFTHGKRPRRQSNETIITNTTQNNSIHQTNRKRNHLSDNDVFSPLQTNGKSLHNSTQGGMSKKRRYTSIPGHPRYIRARRAEAALMEQDRETTPSDLSLEDMLETSILTHEHEHEHDESSGQNVRSRFDRIPMSLCLGRNVFSNAGGRRGQASSPIKRHGRGETTLGELTGGSGGGRWLISPVLTPVKETNTKSRKEKRKLKKQNGLAPLNI
ncbi:hypothetical protein TREMEDRAFT_64950 [Tremella mesenterica DSM 1558]|uniref:uncharacterized protein n=1 Tax=Tremella mesenterica (strain ATCC 24925 / CBS 8224 / DSM 1558 / NBRC 9311 / NRRL Y-6157 / RJB 2259-6 / UBC 559-6) TaxID=578456 RepID=UPI0003F48D3E|nr:uncharacterized protein TREMEDRAFT_64950 [Tremella mesenterica DSM 1558]EIW67081.1 hypothetical protein TREMEDRAFT_64950 [Tremella mesenterica DSM 1558]